MYRSQVTWGLAWPTQLSCRHFFFAANSLAAATAVHTKIESEPWPVHPRRRPWALAPLGSTTSPRKSQPAASDRLRHARGSLELARSEYVPKNKNLACCPCLHADQGRKVTCSSKFNLRSSSGLYFSGKVFYHSQWHPTLCLLNCLETAS